MHRPRRWEASGHPLAQVPAARSRWASAGCWRGWEEEPGGVCLAALGSGHALLGLRGAPSQISHSRPALAGGAGPR